MDTTTLLMYLGLYAILLCFEDTCWILVNIVIKIVVN